MDSSTTSRRVLNSVPKMTNDVMASYSGNSGNSGYRSKPQNMSHRVQNRQKIAKKRQASEQVSSQGQISPENYQASEQVSSQGQISPENYQASEQVSSQGQISPERQPRSGKQAYQRNPNNFKRNYRASSPRQPRNGKQSYHQRYPNNPKMGQQKFDNSKQASWNKLDQGNNESECVYPQLYQVCSDGRFVPVCCHPVSSIPPENEHDTSGQAFSNGSKCQINCQQQMHENSNGPRFVKDNHARAPKTQQISDNSNNNVSSSESVSPLRGIHLDKIPDDIKLLGYGYDNNISLYDLDLNNSVNNNIDQLFKTNFEYLKEKYNSIKDYYENQQELVEGFIGYLISAIINGPSKIVLSSSKNLQEMLDSLNGAHIKTTGYLSSLSTNGTIINPGVIKTYDLVKTLGSAIKQTLDSKNKDQDIYIDKLETFHAPPNFDKEKHSINNQWYCDYETITDDFRLYQPILFLPYVTMDLEQIIGEFGSGFAETFKYYLTCYFLFISENCDKEFDQLYPSNEGLRALSDDLIQVKVNYYILILLIKTILLKKPEILDFAFKTYENGSSEEVKDNNIGMYFHQLDTNDHEGETLVYNKQDSKLFKFNRSKAFYISKTKDINKRKEEEDKMVLDLIKNCFMGVKIDFSQFIQTI